jgi:hypothetical protein
VDSTSNLPTIYVGTDSGVFSSSSVIPTWTEVGPPSNQPGFLPNVSVTALRLFNSGGTKRLRASTYGRGIWEFNLITTPDFQASFSNNPLTVFVGQSAVFNGTLTALNGYSSSVDLSCANPKPPNCSVSLTTWTPPPDVQFTVTASGPAADYLFDVHAVGHDVNAVTHDFPLTLHVVDFNLTALPHRASPPTGRTARDL